MFFWRQKILGALPPTPHVAADLCILQVRYEPHWSDKVRCSEASRFSITKIWYAYIYSI